MKKYFFIGPDDREWGIAHSYEINAKRDCCLPGVSCNVCNNTWATTGVIYPSISCESLTNIRSSLTPFPISTEIMIDLINMIHNITEDKKLVLLPGTDFGQLHGIAKGEMGDFTWVNPWTPLVRSSVFDLFLQRGLDLIGVEAKLRFNKYIEMSFVEIEARPVVKLHPLCLEASISARCFACGHQTIKTPEKIIIDRNTINDNMPIMRIYDLPTYIVVNEQMASLIYECKFSNVILKEICIEE